MATAQTGTQAIDRAAALLVRVLEGDATSVGSLATAEGLPKSTTSRLVRALERQGLVQRDDDGGALLPGPTLVRWAWSTSAWTALAAIAQPSLQRIGDETGETVNLGLPIAGGVEMVVQIDSRYHLGVGNWVGRRSPLHCSAVGKALMACGGAEVPLEPYARLASRTITTRAELMADLERTRERGWSLLADELEDGLVAIAAPILTDDGVAFAAIAVSGPALRITKERIPAIGALVRDEASALGARLTEINAAKGAA